METYINDTIKAYVDENGKDTVKLEKLTVENNKATLIIEYASAQDYMNFNGIELFTGSVVEALAAGYSFDVDFASIDDGKATECTKDEIIDSSDLKVAIFTGACNVNVSGTILYASVEDTKLVDKETIAIAKGNNLLNKAVEETEAGTEENMFQRKSLERQERKLPSDLEYWYWWQRQEPADTAPMTGSWMEKPWDARSPYMA